MSTIHPESESHSEKSSTNKKGGNLSGDGLFVGDVETLEAQGTAHFSRLGWKRLTVVLLVEAIALGALSIPSAFATLGMVAGVITTVGLGLVAIYTSYVVGQVKLKFPEVAHYADAGRLIWGRFGYELIGAMFALELTFLVGSHCLTGAIAFGNLTENGTCSLVFGVVSAVILLFLAIPPSFADVAILGYIDFVSIMAAIGITVIATGITYGKSTHVVDWSAWPKDDISFVDAFIAITNIVFACKSTLSLFFKSTLAGPNSHLSRLFRRLSILLHGRNAHTKRLRQIHLVPRPHRDLHLYPNRLLDLRFRRPRRVFTRPPLRRKPHGQNRIRRRPPCDLHLRLHKRHRRSTLHPRTHLQELCRALHQHQERLDDMACSHRRHHHRRLGHRGSYSLLWRSLGYNVRAFHLRIHVLLPGYLLVPAYQGGEVV